MEGVSKIEFKQVRVVLATEGFCAVSKELGSIEDAEAWLNIVRKKPRNCRIEEDELFWYFISNFKGFNPTTEPLQRQIDFNIVKNPAPAIRDGHIEYFVTINELDFVKQMMKHTPTLPKGGCYQVDIQPIDVKQSVYEWGCSMYNM
jgi:hypothetical protein